jgi:hypothetical protein
MRTLKLLLAALLTAVTLLIAACGGGAPSANDPAGSVKAALAATQSGGFSKLADYACAAKKGSIADLFGGGGASSLASAGIDTQGLFDSMKIEFTDVNASETSKTADAAVVHVTGKAKITVDPAKFRPIMKKMLEAQGQTIDDATLDAALSAMSGQLNQDTAIDQTVNLVNEGGKWLICS